VRVDDRGVASNIRGLSGPALSPILSAIQIWVVKSVTHLMRLQRIALTHESKVPSVAACSRSASPETCAISLRSLSLGARTIYLRTYLVSWSAHARVESHCRLANEVSQSVLGRSEEVSKHARHF